MRITSYNVSALEMMMIVPFCILKAPPVLCSKRLDGGCLWRVHVTIVAGDGTHRLNQGVVSGALKQLPKKNYSHDIVTPNVNANSSTSHREHIFVSGKDLSTLLISPDSATNSDIFISLVIWAATIRQFPFHQKLFNSS